MRTLVLLLVAVAITAAHANSFVKEEEYLAEKERYLAEKEQYLTEKEQYLTDQENANSFVKKQQNVTKELYLTDKERNQAMDEAIGEAMIAMEARTVEKRSRVVSSISKQEYTSIQFLHKFFKRPSEEASKMGKANQLYRDIVDRAERKMIEVQHEKTTMSQGPKARVESLAETLYLRPGNIITSKELTRAWQLARNVFGAGKEVPTCDSQTVDLYRTIDGTCNNKENPLFGAAGIAFRRLVPPVYGDGVSTLRCAASKKSFSIPSARVISRKIINDVADDEISFTHLLMQFGQFLDHDVDLGPELEQEGGCKACVFTEVCQPIKVDSNDPDFTTNYLTFHRSVSTLDPNPPTTLLPLQQVNDVTSFIDGSMIYGSRLDLAMTLRTKEGGCLKTGAKQRDDQKPTLPIDNQSNVACREETPCFLCGDVRCNEQISLTIMHTLWLREHNRCAREMKNVNPLWLDEQLYQVCRKIVGALIQKITYRDYLPKVLGPSNFNRYIGDQYKYDSSIDASIPNSFATAAYRYGHSLIRPSFGRYGETYNCLGRLNLVDAFFNPNQFRAVGGTDPIMRGWVTENSRRMDESMSSDLTSHLFQTKNTPGLDLASLNIQRGRDHGLPKYSVFKELCFKEFELELQLKPDIIYKIEKAQTLSNLIDVYRSIDEADVWVAGLAEKRLADGLLGPTFACIFGLTFQALRDGDRFFWENDNVFTPIQKDSIEKHSFSRVICDNSDNIQKIQPDAFKIDTNRILCTDPAIGRVDLDLFKEKDCHIRVRVYAPGYYYGTIIIRSNLGTRSLKIQSICDCFPVECPTESTDSTVRFGISTAYRRSTLAWSKSIGRNPTGFILKKSLLDNNSGVYATKKSCKSSTRLAFLIHVRTFARTFGNEKENLQDDVIQEMGSEDSDFLEKEFPEDDVTEQLEFEIPTVNVGN